MELHLAGREDQQSVPPGIHLQPRTARRSSASACQMDGSNVQLIRCMTVLNDECQLELVR